MVDTRPSPTPSRNKRNLESEQTLAPGFSDQPWMRCPHFLRDTSEKARVVVSVRWATKHEMSFFSLFLSPVCPNRARNLWRFVSVFFFWDWGAGFFSGGVESLSAIKGIATRHHNVCYIPPPHQIALFPFPPMACPFFFSLFSFLTISIAQSLLFVCLSLSEKIKKIDMWSVVCNQPQPLLTQYLHKVNIGIVICLMLCVCLMRSTVRVS